MCACAPSRRAARARGGQRVASRASCRLGIGQEGVAAAVMGTLRAEDWVVAAHRSHLAAIAEAVPLRPLLAEIYEKATGLCGGKGGHLHLFDLANRFSTTGIVGSSLAVALGHAYSARLEGTTGIAVGLTGDGFGTNTGQFPEVMNMAALWVPAAGGAGRGQRLRISRTDRELDGRAGHRRTRGRVRRVVRERGRHRRRATAEAFAEAAAYARSGRGPARWWPSATVSPVTTRAIQTTTGRRRRRRPCVPRGSAGDHTAAVDRGRRDRPGPGRAAPRHRDRDGRAAHGGAGRPVPDASQAPTGVYAGSRA